MDTIGTGLTTKLTKEDIMKSLDLLKALEAKKFTVLNTKNESFIQFIIDKSGYILDFPDYETNENHNKSLQLLETLINHSFAITGSHTGEGSIKEKEIVEEALDEGVLIQANCGNDMSFIAELIKELSLKIFGISDQDLINIEYMD